LVRAIGSESAATVDTAETPVIELQADRSEASPGDEVHLSVLNHSADPVSFGSLLKIHRLVGNDWQNATQEILGSPAGGDFKRTWAPPGESADARLVRIPEDAEPGQLRLTKQIDLAPDGSHERELISVATEVEIVAAG